MRIVRTWACWAKRSRWMTGSFSSVYALASSRVLTNSSKRSVSPGSVRCLQQKEIDCNQMAKYLMYAQAIQLLGVGK